MQILALCLSPFILTVNRVKLSEKGRKEIPDRVIAACKKLGKLPRPVRIRQNGKLLLCLIFDICGLKIRVAESYHIAAS